jgi:hypothetical protein
MYSTILYKYFAIHRKLRNVTKAEHRKTPFCFHTYSLLICQSFMVLQFEIRPEKIHALCPVSFALLSCALLCQSDLLCAITMINTSSVSNELTGLISSNYDYLIKF